MSWRSALEQEWYAENGGLLSYLLVPLGKIYCALAARRRAQALPRPSAIPSIVVGNLGVGGSAKTPTTLALLRWLETEGWQPAAVSRGYGGHPPQQPYRVAPADDPEQAGDEPLLLRQVAPVYLSRHRHQGIQAAAADGHDIVVLDDGFQHLALRPTLSILLLLGERPLGNGRCLPAGPLREGPSTLAAADALLCDDAASQSHWLRQSVQPIFRMEAKVQGLYVLQDGRALPLSTLHGTRVQAVTGIARPERFRRTLESLGAKVDMHSFPDHHRFHQEDFRGLSSPLVMTAKDAVKCRFLEGLPEAWVLEQGIHWGPDFSAWLRAQLASRRFLP